MSETKVLTPNNVVEASSTTNGEVQTGMLISMKINRIPIAANADYNNTDESVSTLSIIISENKKIQSKIGS